MPVNPYTSSDEQFEHFTEALSAAFHAVVIPSGVIDGENIVDGSIRPEKCELNTNWDFGGRVTAQNVRASGSGGSKTDLSAITLNPLRLSTTKVYDHYDVGEHTIVLVDTSQKVVVLTLPLAAEHKDEVYIIKRVDDSKQTGCTLVPTTGDKIDLVTYVDIPERGSLICVSSGTGWHILANYS